MYWTKIPTDLITCRTPDIEILSIVKYQLLWAEHEQQPTDEIALRYLTPKQLSYAKKWLSSIESQIVSDIKNVETNRKNRRINYHKNKDLAKNVSSTVTGTVYSTVSSSVDTVEEDKIRIDKKKEINKESLTQYGEFKNVCLPEEYYTKLQGEHSQAEIDWAVEKLDSWLDNPKQKSKLNKNHRGYFKKDSWVWEGYIKKDIPVQSNPIPADIDLYEGKYFDFNLNRVVATKEDNPDWSKYNRATGEFDL